MIALLAATLRVSVILLLALGLVWLLRKRTASLRHAVLVIALLCAAVVPLLGAVVPQWAARAIVIPQLLPPLPAPDLPPAPYPALSTSIADTTEPLVRDTPASAMEPVVPAATTADRSADWQSFLPRIIKTAGILYLAGLGVSLAMLGLGLLQLRWIAARSAPMAYDYWQWQVSEISDIYRLRRPVHLAHTRHAAMLATWGILRPQILLPADAGDWPDDRIRAVLLHELAHIRRNDWIIQMFAGLLRAVYWFNPLVWIACARLRQECEQACDDEVLARGVKGAEYADHLLALARAFTRPAALLAPAPSMAHRSTLRRRIAAILDPAVTRAPASHMSVTKLAAALVAVTCVAAACRVAPPAGRIDAASRIGPRTQVRVVAAPTVVTADGPATDVDPGTASSEAPAIPAMQIAYASATDAMAAPRMVAAGILELATAALADEDPVPLSQFEGVARTLNSVQRRAREVIGHDGRNLASLAEKYTGLINELGYAANAAMGASGSSRPRLSTPRLQQLAADLRARAAELADAALPVADGTSAEANSAALPVAVAARDIASTALADTSFVGPRLHTWLVEELSTLQRAARSVLADDGRNPRAATTKRYALLSSARSTTRNAYAIADRAGESEATRDKAKNLAMSLRDLDSQLEQLTARSLVRVAAPVGIAPGLATVPTVGCPGDGQVGPQHAPANGVRAVDIDARIAANLAYYYSSPELGVLAPRGWQCLALAGSGGQSLYVTPQQKVSAGELLGGDSRGITGPAIQVSMNIGDTSGRFAAARYIARLFPQARSFVDAVIAENLVPASSFPSGPYPEDQLTRRSASVVEYLTPAGNTGLGYDSRLAPGEDAISGVVILHDTDHSVQKLSVRLPAESRGLAPAIIRQLENDAGRAERPGLGSEGQPTDDGRSRASERILQ